MSVDYSKLQLLTSNSSNKVLLEGSGAFTIPALGGAGTSIGTGTIPHGYANDKLLWQVATFTNVTSEYVILPWESNDGRFNQFCYLDSTNLYVLGITSSAGPPVAAYTVTYYYRILVP